MSDVDERLRTCQKVTFEAIEKVLAEHGAYQANCYSGGLLLGLAQSMIKRYGRRAAYDYFQQFVDGLVISEDE